MLLYLVVEIVALVALGSVIGLGWTLLVLLAGSVIGVFVARREGVRAAQALATAMAQRRVATNEMTDGLLVAAAGVLLFVPGLVTDLAGLLLLVPPVRRLVRGRLVAAAERQSPGLRRARIHSEGAVVDGTVVDGPGFSHPTADSGSRVLGGGPVVEGSVVDGTVVEGGVVDGEVVDDSDRQDRRRSA